MKKILPALLIALLALFLRVFMAFNSPIDADEPVYVTAAAQLNQAMRQGDWNRILDSTFNTEHPQFYKLVYATALLEGQPLPGLSITAIGHGPDYVSYWPKLLMLRDISALLGAAAVFLLSLVSPLAGLFLAVDTLAIEYTSQVYLEALPAFTCMVALLAALKAADAFRDQPARRRKWIGWLVLSALALGMTAASKYMYAVVGIAIAIAVILRLWKHKLPALLGLAAWGVLSLAFFFLLDPVLWHAPLARLSASVQYSFSYEVGAHVTQVGYPWWQPIWWLLLPVTQQPAGTFFLPENGFFALADSLIFVLALVGLPRIFLKNKPFFIWLVVGMAFLLLWGTKWPQYMLLVLAPWCLAAGYGLEFLIEKFALLTHQSRPQSTG